MRFTRNFTALGLSPMQGMLADSNGRKPLLNIVPSGHLRLGLRLGPPAPLDSGLHDRAGEVAQEEEPAVAIEAESGCLVTLFASHHLVMLAHFVLIMCSSTSVACEQPSGTLAP